MASLNISQFISEISIQSKKQLEGLAKGAAQSKFTAARADLIEDFETHEVSKEIKEGPNADKSQFISKGGLFSALGFYAGSDPVGNVSEILRTNIILDKSPVKTEVFPRKLEFRYTFKVETPTLAEIKAAAPLDWTSRSWIKEIEEGISNLTLYIFSRKLSKKANSRSGTGLQIKNKTTESAVYHPPTSYLTQMLKKFKERIRGE